MIDAKMRVLLITSRSDLGGGPKQVAEILDNLNDKFDFFVAAPNSGEYAKIFKSQSQYFYELPHRKTSFVSIFGLLFFCREHQIQIIHSHGFGAGVFAFLPSLFGVNVIHTFHGLHFQKTLKGLFKNTVERVLSLARTNHICVSQSEKLKAATLGITAEVIPNGITESQRELRKTNIQHQAKLVGVLSRLDSFKNVSWVINNYDLIAKTWPDVKIEIAGDGEDKDNLQKQITKHNLDSVIKMVGSQPPLSFFERIDILLCPSKGEGLPYTVLEAMSFGVPIVASKVPGHVDLLPSQNLFSLENADFSILSPYDTIERNQNLIASKYDLKKNMIKIGNLYIRYCQAGS